MNETTIANKMSCFGGDHYPLSLYNIKYSTKQLGDENIETDRLEN